MAQIKTKFIANNAVTAVKLGTVTDGITLDQSGAGTTLEIKTNGVGTTQLAAASVTAAKLGSVTDGITLDQSGSGSTIEVKTGGISNTQVNATAAIDFSKLAALPSADILVGNGSNVATAVPASGDLTLANTGAFTVAKIQGTTVSGTTGTGNIVFSASPTLTGTLTAAAVSLSGALNMNSNQIHNVTDPSSPQDAATKFYVDSTLNGLSWKNAALVATTANITLSGEQTIDGFLTSASRVLVKNQTLSQNNGLYTSAAGAWTRTADMNTWAMVPAAAVFIQEGTVNGDIGYVCTSQPGGTLGTTAITFVQFSSAGAYTADGVTLQLIGGQFSIKNGGVTETQINNSALSATGALSGGSGTKLSVNVDNSTIDISGDNLEVKAGGITNTQVSASAGITYGKLNLSASVRASDINSQASTSNQVLTADGAGGASFQTPPTAAIATEQHPTLSSGDITNQYYDLSFQALGSSAAVNSVSVDVYGGPEQLKGTDYTVSLTGGSGGVTRLTFAGDLATGGNAALVAGDILMIKYEH